MKKIIELIFHYGPLVFAFGFLAPLFAEIVTRTQWTPPFSLSPMFFGLIAAGALGLIAQIRGRWI